MGESQGDAPILIADNQDYFQLLTVDICRISKYTNKALISAGLTPPIREAWPMVAGLIFVNFSRDSIDKVSIFM